MRLTVRTKMVVVFTIIFLMIGGLSWIDMSRMGALKDNTKKLAENWMMGIQIIEEIHYNSDHILAIYYQKKLEPDVKKHEPLDAGMAASIASIDKLLADYKESLAGEEDANYFNELNKNWEDFKAAFMKNKQIAADPNKVKEAAESLQVMATTFGKAQKTMADMVVFNQEGGRKAELESLNVYKSSVNTSLIVLSVIIAFMLITCYILVRNISSPVRKASQSLNRIANDYSSKK
ncbi:MCP four helix bundle domain-containing protein [Paenibacillus sp. Root444D2]|uniref:MCP four helix bundle domain-containing protein n=1 Tax=Paenibacillus sp. Root444D2 TaxID=1736538 RepID=UPI000710BA2A|nr:MCP four helix bundle domain-containing protein [Paenibacillus sp. Root444D2]KQX45756.1 hypothetical protein ASD40_18035 [Paenibacillus sp. Root444D2]